MKKQRDLDVRAYIKRLGLPCWAHSANLYLCYCGCYHEYIYYGSGDLNSLERRIIGDSEVTRCYDVNDIKGAVNQIIARAKRIESYRDASAANDKASVI